ncbi:MAG: low molecular weight protein arginine phosphatase [Verrucomicrobiales bacterium]
MSGARREVLFVCTGNTCRSPMAEGLFRKLVAGEDYGVGSAGVAAMPGSAMSAETAMILARKEAEVPDFASRAVTEDLLEQADGVFCMTASHRDLLLAHFPDFAKKVHLVCDFVEFNGLRGVDVPDPIGMGMSAYEGVAEVLEKALVGVKAHLEAEKKEA